ncbi:MAG: hypothetical protein PV340_01360 [Wolbachia sp.]|nr:hypothetical protein [Wolbachia sp.]MDD9336332.1 hypothetical protein [Wolbachia sp.]
MRIAILHNIEKIIEEKKAIYMDFDILPDEKGRNLRKIRMPKGILVDKMNDDAFKASYTENSIIAIDDQNNYILPNTLSRVQDTLK